MKKVFETLVTQKKRIDGIIFFQAQIQPRHSDMFRGHEIKKCLVFQFFINLGYEFDMSHFLSQIQSFSLIEQSTSETISTSGQLPATCPPFSVALLLLVFGCCC